MQERIAVIDFETTGISPSSYCRATEIAVVIVEQGVIVERYQSLMNAGVRIPSFIESLTGISNSMLRTAPPAERVMNEVAEFVGLTPLVAHNASFDQKFWDFELSRIKRNRVQSFACSMLLARRLLPSAPNHKLGTLTSWAGLPHMRKWRPTSRCTWATNCATPMAWRAFPTSCCVHCRRFRRKRLPKR
jgi:DNA polymerase-3 subunit epsilon